MKTPYTRTPRHLLLLLAAVMVLLSACKGSAPQSPGTPAASVETEPSGVLEDAPAADPGTAVTEENFRDFPVSDADIFTLDHLDDGIEIEGCKRDIPDRVIVVPDKIAGEDVVSIGPGAFTEVGHVEAIVLPDTVKTIGTSAFTGLEYLKYIYLGSGLKATGDMLFNYCPSLERIELPEGTEKINGYLAVRCAGLKEVVVPASVTKIEGRMLESFDFEGVVRTPSGSEAEKNAIDAGVKVENY